jgi:hypothetical protein
VLLWVRGCEVDEIGGVGGDPRDAALLDGAVEALDLGTRNLPLFPGVLQS